MPKHSTMDIATAAQSGVTIKRAWKSAEVWNYLAGFLLALFGLAAALVPTALPFIDQLQLSPFWTMVIVLGLNAVLIINGWLLKLTSTTVVGGKIEVGIARDALDVNEGGH